MTNTTNKYSFLIGWNNKTHKREIKKAINTLNNLKVLGFNVNKNLLGFWNNERENSFSIEIISNNDNPFNDLNAIELKKQLEKNLNQFLVLTTKQEIEVL